MNQHNNVLGSPIFSTQAYQNSLAKTDQVARFPFTLLNGAPIVSKPSIPAAGAQNHPPAAATQNQPPASMQLYRTIGTITVVNQNRGSN